MCTRSFTDALSPILEPRPSLDAAGRGALLTLVFTALARWLRGVTNCGRIGRGGLLFRSLSGRRPRSLCGADHSFRPGLDHHPARLPTQAEVRRRGKTGRTQRVSGPGQSRRGYGLCACCFCSTPAGKLSLGIVRRAFRSRSRHGFKRGRSGLRGQSPADHQLGICSCRNEWRGQRDWNAGRNRGRRNRELGLRSRWAASPNLAGNFRGGSRPGYGCGQFPGRVAGAQPPAQQRLRNFHEYAGRRCGGVRPPVESPEFSGRFRFLPRQVMYLWSLPQVTPASENWSASWLNDARISLLCLGFSRNSSSKARKAKKVDLK